jgi:hypothetical protein
MYPAQIFALFPPHARKDSVFVAMSFDPQFDALWKDVLTPAIAGVKYNGVVLTPHRIDLSKKGDSIITEIGQHIAEDRLVLADVSTMAWLVKNRKKTRPVRNGNVMYELGLAHATRLPEEVIIVRGDSDPLDFDVSGVRVHRYPTEVMEAAAFVGHLLVDALRAVDQRRSIAVRQALQGLTPHMFILLHATGELTYPNPKTMRDHFDTEEERAAVKELLTGGMLEAIYRPLPQDFMNAPVTDLFKYRVTSFGLAVYQAARLDLKFNEALVPWLQSADGIAWLEAGKGHGNAGTAEAR